MSESLTVGTVKLEAASVDMILQRAPMAMEVMAASSLILVMSGWTRHQKVR